VECGHGSDATAEAAERLGERAQHSATGLCFETEHVLAPLVASRSIVPGIPGVASAGDRPLPADRGAQPIRLTTSAPPRALSIVSLARRISRATPPRRAPRCVVIDDDPQREAVGAELLQQGVLIRCLASANPPAPRRRRVADQRGGRGHRDGPASPATPDRSRRSAPLAGCRKKRDPGSEHTQPTMW